MNKEEWKDKFKVEFRKGTTRGTEIDEEYEAWIETEAENAFSELNGTPFGDDPEECARETLYAIAVSE